jgi:phage repressor protein C with HTH and peptisase S24 domain
MQAASMIRGDTMQYLPPVSWRERLRAAVDASGRKQSAIAEQAGVAPETLSRVLSGVHAQPSFDTIVRIAHSVGENVGTLIGEPAFLLDAEQRADVRRVIEYLEAAVGASPTVTLAAEANAAARRAGEVPRTYYARGARQVFVAAGDSMIGAGIADGDLLFVAPASAIRDSASRIVVCRIAGAVYVKQLELSGGRLRLLSRNRRYATIEVDEDDFELLGVVIGRSGDVAGPLGVGDQLPGSR